MTDTFSQSGAEELAATIRRHWAKQGGDQPHVWTEMIEAPLRLSRPTLTELWVVRSDMLRGKPRREFAELTA